MANYSSSLKPNPSPFAQSGLLSGVLNKGADLGQNISNVGKGFSTWFNNSGPGRFHNPSSSEYLGSKPNVASSILPKANAQTTGVVKTAQSQPTTGLLQNNIQNSQPQGQYSTSSTGQKIPVLPGNSAPIGPNNNTNNSLYSQVLTNLRDQGTQNPAATSIQGLQDIAQKETPEVTQARKNAEQVQLLQNDVRNNPNVAAEVSVGRGNALSGLVTAAQQAYQNALGSQGQRITAGQDAGQLGLTNQAQQITAQSNAGTLSKPESGAAFYGSPETGNLVGTSGANGTGNGLIDNAVSNAVSMIRSGGSTADALASLSSLGQPAQQAFFSQMRQYDSNWNPTSSNAIAQQNMSQGQEYQGQAAQLDTALKQLDVITPNVINFLNSSGLNSEEQPFFNKAKNEYVSQLQNPGNQKIFNALMGDVKKYTAQILGATGEINPTRIGEINDSFDPSLLNSKQLATFLTDLKKLGTNQLSVLQGQSRNSYGGSQGYQGANANSTNSLITAAPNSPSKLNTNNSVIQGLIGTGMNAAGSIEGLIKGFASTILK